jgi:hypothetical protein
VSASPTTISMVPVSFSTRRCSAQITISHAGSAGVVNWSWNWSEPTIPNGGGYWSYTVNGNAVSAPVSGTLDSGESEVLVLTSHDNKSLSPPCNQSPATPYHATINVSTSSQVIHVTVLFN